MNQWILDYAGKDSLIVRPAGTRLAASVCRVDLTQEFTVLRDQLRAWSEAQGQAGQLELLVPDERSRGAVALGAAGWHDVRLQSEVAVVDAREPEIADDVDDVVEHQVAVEPRQATEPAAQEPSAPVPPAPVEESYVRVLYGLLKAAWWYGANAELTLSLKKKVVSHPDAPVWAEKDASRKIAQGVRISTALGRIDELARRKGQNSPELKAAIEEERAKLQFFRAFDYQVQRTIERTFKMKQRGQAARAYVTSVRPGRDDHRIQALSPSPEWQLLIDEGGNIPERGQQAPGRVGRFVGVLVPLPCPLRPLDPGWHAVDQVELQKIDEPVQAVLDAPVGVFGITLDALPPSLGDRWVTGVVEVIHWVCRLLPIGGATKLEVLVEQRGEYVPQVSWKALAAEMLRQLAEANPERYSQLSLTVRLITKNDSPFNGYVDAIAFSWVSPTAPSSMRLKASGLLDVCLHSGNAGELRRAWDAVGAGRRVAPELWQQLVANREAGVQGSLIAEMLDRLAGKAKREPAYWHELLLATQAHLDSKAVRLGDLGREIEFLVGCAPSDERLLPKMELALLTAKLERQNHLGSVDGATEERLNQLAESLADEVPTMVCQADLDRAVLATNRFDFVAASHALARWESCKPREPGLQHWGRVQSSLGQHAAFQGRFGDAVDRFGRALAALERLSDKRVAIGECAQTASYLAIATMDNSSASPAAVVERLERVVSTGPEEISAMARKSGADSKYSHHVLLRFLVGHGTPDQRAAYLAGQASWNVGDGHPWQLIELYRALLLHGQGDRDGAKERIHSAVQIALAADQGPTVAFIGLVIDLVSGLLGYGRCWRPEQVKHVREALPLAPWAVVDSVLAGGAEIGVTQLLGRCLPFNFR